MEKETLAVTTKSKNKRKDSNKFPRRLRKRAKLEKELNVEQQQGEASSSEISSDSATDSRSEGEEGDEGMTLKELEEQLEKNAAMKNLTVKNVKSILHYVLSDKRLIALAKTSAGEVDGEVDTQKQVNIVPDLKMTRARCRQTDEEITDEAAEKLFVDMELSEDSDDQEYTPEVDTETFYEDSLASASDFQSPPGSFLNEVEDSIGKSGFPGDGIVKIKIEEDDDDDEEEIFKIPSVPEKNKADTGEELISKRTRSQLPLKNLSLESIEATFCDPDFDPEMYEGFSSETDEEDKDWKLFLKSLMREEPSLNDSVDDLDDDFNYMENEEEEVIDQEEYRNDRAVQVSQRELQDMFDELLEGFKPLAPQVENTVESKNLEVGDPFLKGQRLQLAAQFQQHLQLLVQVSLLCYYDPSLAEEAEASKALVKELKLFNDRANELTQLKESRSAFCIKAIHDASEIIEAHSNPPLPEHCHYFNPIPPGENNDLLLKKRPPSVPSPIPCMAANKFAKCQYFALYPELIPVQGMISRKMNQRSPDVSRLRFTQAEDNLLAIGTASFKNDYKIISEQLLPTKTPKQLKNRCKNLRSKREPLNPVKVYTKTNILPPLMTDFIELDPREAKEEPLCKCYKILPKDGTVPEWILRVAEKFNSLPKTMTLEEFDEKTQAYMKRNQLRAIAIRDEDVKVVNEDDCSDFHLLQPTAALQLSGEYSSIFSLSKTSTESAIQPQAKAGINDTILQGKSTGNGSKDFKTGDLHKPKSSCQKAVTSSVNVSTNTIPTQTLIQVVTSSPKPVTLLTRGAQGTNELIPLQPINIAPKVALPTTPKALPKLKSTTLFNTIRPTRSRMKVGRSPVVSPNNTVPKNQLHTRSSDQPSELLSSPNSNSTAGVNSGMDLPDDSNQNTPVTSTESLPVPSVSKCKGRIRVKKGNKTSSNNGKVKFNWKEKSEEKRINYAEHYFRKAKDVICAKQPELWTEFLSLMDACTRKEYSSLETYKELASKLREYPELLDDFVAFLTESEACEVGKFMVWMDFDRAKSFLLNCEAMFFKNASQYEDLVNALLDCYNANKSTEEYLEIITPLLRGNQALVDDFKAFFPDLPLVVKCKEEEFEVIPYSEENGFRQLDEFEEVHLHLENDFDTQCNSKKNKVTEKDGRRPKLSKNIRLPKSPSQNSTRRTAWNAKRAAVRTLTTGANIRKPRPKRVLLKDETPFEEGLVDESVKEPANDKHPCPISNRGESQSEKEKFDFCVKQLDESTSQNKPDSQNVNSSRENSTVTNQTKETPLSTGKGDECKTDDNCGSSFEIGKITNSSWTSEEDQLILTAFQEMDNCDSVFTKISKKVQGKTSLDVMNRFKYLIKMCTATPIVEEQVPFKESPVWESSSP